MLYRPDRDLLQLDSEDPLDRLDERLRRADVVTPGLLSDAVAQLCNRCARHAGTAKFRLDALIEAGAFTDAALALIELELPRWKVRRLVHDEGEWICSLSTQPNLPIELDDVAEAAHES